MNVLRKLFNNLWCEIDQTLYAEAYHKYGGSVITHPKMLNAIQIATDIPTHYYGVFENNKIIAACAQWKNYLAGDRLAIRKFRCNKIIDLGNPEVILPCAANQSLQLNARASFISAQHKDQFLGLKQNKKFHLCLAKDIESDFSSRARKKLRYELRRFLQQGGEYHPIADYTPDQICQFYFDLHKKRWGKLPCGMPFYQQHFELLYPLLHGHVLFFREQPAAIQIIYRADLPQSISMEYINGGYDVDLAMYSTGKLLVYLNVLAAWEIAKQHNKTLRYSFGIDDQKYKRHWCDIYPIYCS